jgi:hypothetical protein
MWGLTLMQLNAAQHVSGVLTSRQSPKGQAGYQTLFFTHELLTPDEIRIIERQAQFSFSGESQAKWQSYRLNSNRHVLSRITPIAEPDEFGRRGRFFAHSLIFDAANTSQIDEILFDLMHASKFFGFLDNVLASDALSAGNIPVVSVDGKKEGAKEAQNSLRDWRGEQLDQLYLLMRNPGQLIEERQHVTLLGSENEIIAALKVAFLLTPASERKFCSFDTRAPTGIEQSDIPFWGRGVQASEATNYLIDGGRREVRVRAASPVLEGGFSLEKVSPALGEAILERLKRPSEQMLASLLNRRYAAFIAEPIYQALLHENELPLSATDLEFLTQFQHMHSGLALLLSLKTGNESQRLKTLASMDVHSYQQRLKELRTTTDFKPWQGLSPVYMVSWLRVFHGKYGIEDISTAISAVAKHGDKQDREYIESIYEYLDSEERQSLSRWLKSSPYDFRRLQVGLDKPVSTRTNHKDNWLRRTLHLRRK